MADKIQLDGMGAERVAMEMAYNIILNIENKSWEQTTRVEYLKTVVQCVRALKGIDPS